MPSSDMSNKCKDICRPAHNFNRFSCMIFHKSIFLSFVSGAPNNPSSLHYVNPYSPNQYVQALNSVGRIIEDYDS